MFSLIEVSAVESDAAGFDSVLGDTPPSKGWSAPTVELGFPADADDPTLTSDLLELHFNHMDDIAVATRASPGDPWGEYQLVAMLLSPMKDSTPDLAPDGLTMYLASDRADTIGDYDIYVASRANRGGTWSLPTHVSGLSGTGPDHSASIDATGRFLVFCSNDTIFTTSRQDAGSVWTVPKTEAIISSSDGEDGTFLMPDGLTVYFDSDRPGGPGNSDLYVATRPTLTDPFEAPVLVEGVNSSDDDADAWVSPDGRHLYFISQRSGNRLLYHSTR
jgi:Tol biopolymer transport system component